ncbi:MAG: DMT family transporter [Pseudomonadota bacterium]
MAPEPTSVAVRGTAIFLGFVGMLMFAATLPATRIALDGLSPAFITSGRAVVAAGIAGALLVVTRTPIPSKADVLNLGAIALCLVCGFPLFTGLALQTVGASHGGVVLAILPIATAGAATLLGSERPSPRFWALGAIGAAVLLLFTLSSAGWTVQLGDIFLLFAAASAAFGYAVSGTLSQTMKGWRVIAWALVLALPATVSFSVVFAPSQWPTAPWVWGGFIYVSVFSMFVGIVFWNGAMALGGISKIAQIQLLQPFFTIAIAAVFVGEALEARQIGFALVLVLIVAAAQRARVARRSDVLRGAEP